MARVRELDGLRGIAAMAVVLSHVTGAHNSRYPNDPAALFDVWWGAYGVQLFFLISGFIIVALREQTRMLTIAPLQWLGKISYSLYLTHSIISYAIIHALWPYLGRQGAVVVAIGASLLAGWGSTNWRRSGSVGGRGAALFRCGIAGQITSSSSPHARSGPAGRHKSLGPQSWLFDEAPRYPGKTNVVANIAKMFGNKPKRAMPKNTSSYATGNA